MRWAGDRGLLPRRGDDLGYAFHALLTASFGELAPRPFAVQQHPRLPAQVLAYSNHPAVELREAASLYAEPAAVAALGLPSLVGKAMPEQFTSGQRLGFTVRVRPTIRTDREGDRDRVRERDAFLAAVSGIPPGAGPSRGEVYGAWLQGHLRRGGAEPEQLALDAFRLEDVQRRDGARALLSQRGPDAAFSGILRVVEPEAFTALLARGVGRHRSFGFGMLLLRPVRSTAC